jgi:predicted acyl esterase
LRPLCTERTEAKRPCLPEALPYPKDDVTFSEVSEYERLRDEFGYAVCRVDLRGAGSSQGLATDEYPVAAELEFEATSWKFDDGHELRLAVTGMDWC